MKKLFYLSLTVCILIFAFSCKKQNNTDSETPQISFSNFVWADKQHAILTFNFKDGDGDIGLQQSDTAEYDFWMRYNYKSPTTGQFVTYYHAIPGLPATSLIDSNIFTYRIPYIDNKSKIKSLDGQIIVNLNGYIPPFYRPNSNDSLLHVRYDFYIYDRARHKSNVATTPEFDLPF